jgi:hypothetical protein
MSTLPDRSVCSEWVAARRLGLQLVQTYHTDLHAYVEAYRCPVPRVARRGTALCPAARTASAAGAARPGRRRDALDACNALLLRDCDAVVVPTRAVLNRIALPVSDERTFVVPSGVAPRPTTPEHVATFRQRYTESPTTTGSSCSSVGSIARRGSALLIDAFARIVARHASAS